MVLTALTPNGVTRCDIRLPYQVPSDFWTFGDDIAPTSQALLPEELATLFDEEIDERVARLAADGGDVN